jgi:hypothetical protein
VSLRVTDQGELLWAKTTEVERLDCALVPSLVARSLEPALSVLPGWQLESWRTHHLTELALVATGSLPAAARFGGAGRVLAPLAGVLRWGVDLEGTWSLLERSSSGEFQVANLHVGTGPSLRFPVGQDAVQLHTRASVGPAVVVLRDLLADDVNVGARVATSAEATFASRSWLRIGIRAEVPVVRLAIRFEDTGQLVPEPPFRVGLVVGIGGTLRGSEAAPAERR